MPFELSIFPVDRFENTKVIDRIGLYAGLGVFILVICILLLSTLPLVIPRFEEPEWVILWGQLALVLCYSFVIIRFQGKGHSTINLPPAVAAILLVIFYSLSRYGIAAYGSGLLGGREGMLIKQALELIVYFALSLYLFRLLTQLLYGMAIRDVRKQAKEESIKALRKEYDQVRQDRSLSGRERRATLNEIETSVDRIRGISVENIFYQTMRGLGSTMLMLIPVAGLAIAILNYLGHHK